MSFNIRDALALLAIGVPTALALAYAPPAEPEHVMKPKAVTRSVSTSTNYAQVGNTELFYRNSSNYDFMGRLNGQYYGSTYSNGGYKLSIQVNNGNATQINCSQSTDINGVVCTPRVEQQGELARVVYSVENTTDADAVVSLGTHADVMIGNNDRAPITRRIDTVGATYGVTMKDNGAAQLCVLFGSGLAGVNGVDDFWFGTYSQNSSPSAMVGNYTAGGNWMVENGSYDSGMGWCWKNRNVPAGKTVEFSYLIGVGDVNLEPTSSFVATVDNPDLWNNLALPHQLTISGEYESPAGQNGRIEYAVEDSEEWLPLTEELTSGSEFSSTITVTFDDSRTNHVIRFRTVDNVGNASTLNPIVYKDVRYYELSGVKSLPYNFGEPVVQTDVTCALNADQYQLSNYANNTNVGTASFDIVGVFPHSIGRRSYNFSVTPCPLEGGLTIISDTAFVYNPTIVHRPAWKWNDERFASLVEGTDYNISYNSAYAGTATITVIGTNNFTNETSGQFEIDKAAPTIGNGIHIFDEGYNDIIYDGNPHAAKVEPYIGAGFPTIQYLNVEDGSINSDAPIMPGKYKVILSLTEGDNYYAMEPTEIMGITIYAINDADYNAFVALVNALISRGAKVPWSSEIDRISLAKGHNPQFSMGKIVSLNLNGANINGEIPYELFALTNLQSLFLSNNGLTGNAATIVHSLPNLFNLNISDNNFSDFYPPAPERLQHLSIGRMHPSRIVELDLSTATYETVIEQIPTIMTYNVNDRTYDTQLNFPCGWRFIHVYGEYPSGGLHVNPDSEYFTITPWNENDRILYRGKSGDKITVYQDAYLPKYLHDLSSFQIVLKFAQGDVNLDGPVDLRDLQTLINYMTSGMNYIYPVGDFKFSTAAADMWHDDIINVQDIVVLTNVLTDYHPDDDEAASPETRSRLRSIGGESGDEAHIYCADGQLIIDSPVPVAAFDAIVSGASAMTLADNLTEVGFIASIVNRDGESHIVAYSLTGAEIPAGRQTVATVTGNECRVAYAMLSDIAANAIPCIAGRRTGIDDNIAETSPTVTISGNEISLYTPTALNGCRWSIYTTSGTLLASGDCNTLPGYTTLCRVPATMTVAVAVVETPTETITTKLAVTK